MAFEPSTPRQHSHPDIQFKQLRNESPNSQASFDPCERELTNSTSQAYDWSITLSKSDSDSPAAAPPQLTCRAVLVGILVGTLLCFTNTYFGLQTGWVTMGSVQAAIVGFAILKFLLPADDTTFGPLENIALQTVSVATATMPLAGGFVGIIPAFGLLDPPVRLSAFQELRWCAALTYFGIFFTVPLRRQAILVEKLPFPSGTATAKLIDLLHCRNASPELRARWLTLSAAFCISFFASLLGFFRPVCANLPVGSWIGLPALTTWHWTWRPAFSYVGQGMIMGPRSALSMLLGAVIAWGMLGPLAKSQGWIAGSENSWGSAGVHGWLLWVSIGLMLAESMTSGVMILVSECRQAAATIKRSVSQDYVEGDAVEVASQSELVPTAWWTSGLFASLVLAILVISPTFDIPPWQTAFAVLLSCLVAVLAVRALGQTDLNPVTGVGKLSQVIFALLAPGHVVTNLVAGALAESAAMQAGDLMQAFKAGHLLRASPRAQFFASSVGASVSIILTVGIYHLYDSAYGIPSDQFQAPVAHVWVNMALLMKDGISALPYTALLWALIFAVLGVALPLMEGGCGSKTRCFLPSGIAMGIGMYLTPDWTLPRVIGAVAAWFWEKRSPEIYRLHYLMLASGFVLGEVVMSIIGLILKLLNVPS